MRARRPEGAARAGALDRVHAAMGRLFQVRPGERERLALSFAHIFLVVATISLLKPLRNALFIGSFGVGGLPWAFMGVAGASALFIWAYARLSDRTGTRALILSGLAIGSAGLLAFWALLASGTRESRPSAAVAAFYILGAVFSVISASQVWLLANLAFDAREARRLFGILAAGGISGGIAGGYLASYLAPRWGGLSILPVGAVLLVAAAWAANALWIRAGALAGRSSPVPSASDFSLVRGERLRDLWGAVLGSPHASALALMVGIATVAGSLAEFQFSSLAAAAITDGDKLTAFLGFWLSNLSVFSLIFQLALSNRLLRDRGIKASLLFLPLAVAGGSLAVLAWPALWSGVLLKAGDGALKNSLNKSATELLYMPLPERGREKAKMFIDVFVDNLATGLAGLFLLLLTLGPGSSPRLVSLLLLALVAAWIPVLHRVHREYVNSLRKGMEKRTLSLSRESVHPGEAALLGSLAAALRSGNPRQILYALDWLESVREGTEEHLPEFRALLGHPDPAIRLRVLQLLRRLAYPGFSEECRALARAADGSAERLAALRYVLRIGQDPVSSVFPYLMGDDMRLKEAAINALCLEAQRQPALAAKVDWTALLEGLEAHASSTATASAAPGPADPARPADGERKLRIIKARIIGVSGLEARIPDLLELLADPDIEVRKSALAAAGDARWARLAPHLLPHLLALPTRVPARDAIAAQGEGAVAPLRAALHEAALPPDLLKFLPEILGRLGTQSAVAGLVENLGSADQSLRFECIKALNKARKAAPRLRLPHDALESALLRELKGYFQLNALYCQTEPSLLAASDAVFRPADAALFRRELDLLRAALQERLQRALERIFRVLSLRFDARDFHHAYQNLMGGMPFLRANAVELMDNLLPPAWKKLLLPLVESESPLGLAAHSRGLIPVDAPAWPDCLARLVETQDDWIRTLALHMLGRSREARFLPLAREFVDSRDPRVRDAARRAEAAMEPAAATMGARATALGEGA